MKFNVKENQGSVTFIMEDEGKAPIRHIVIVEGRISVKNKPPTVDELREALTLQCKHEGISDDAFLDMYHQNMQDAIERETKELLKCYKKIRNSMESIYVADQIRLSANDWSQE
ncbi:hypothetical protein [Aliivibrio fischeri]|uniref:hypothetical protein n=1 Tax=Aliivibrio fischeri TaxID=668 RepID=UPI0012DA4E73|nr:hypothetical protein [Aliivibrio fischeri]MUL11870.1 hypothetical protein [Aliivibrio fischeri]MUL15460.1 hypothetical protein [Aliivibrio fischeri]